MQYQIYQIIISMERQRVSEFCSATPQTSPPVRATPWIGTRERLHSLSIHLFRHLLELVAVVQNNLLSFCESQRFLAIVPSPIPSSRKDHVVVSSFAFLVLEVEVAELAPDTHFRVMEVFDDQRKDHTFTLRWVKDMASTWPGRWSRQTRDQPPFSPAPFSNATSMVYHLWST